MLYFLQLLEEIKNDRLAPVYLFYGPEEYLRRQALERLKEHLFPNANLREFNLTRLDGSTASAAEILDTATTPPWGARKRLVIVREAPYFAAVARSETDNQSSPAPRGTGKSKSPAKDENKDLLAYLQNPSPATCLVFDISYSPDRRRSLYRQLEKSGRTIEFAWLSPPDIRRWLNQQARLSGLTLDPEAAGELLLRCGRSLNLLYQEMQKLTLYCQDRGIIDRQAVQAVSPPALEEDIFAVVDAMGQRQPDRAIDGLRNLLLQRHPPQVILAMLGRQIRLIWQIAIARRQGARDHQLAALLDLHPFVAQKMSRQSGNFTEEQLRRGLKELHRIDVDIKEGRVDFATAAEHFILRFCAMA
ncbi:MAG: DNA polymerase III subunit delta [Desulfurispora sp.]|uniref:DNA polymerase III subunit delta n=1 Tax=Desulfurispora sp. TaxID=3014275 RepID=UPI00404A249C